MPSNVKVFWWLSVAVVLYWAFSTTWYLAFPTARYLTILANLPPEFREGARHTDILNLLLGTLFRCGSTLGLAWLSAFRRQNWARWAFTALFILRESLLFLVSILYYHQLDFFIQEISRENWTDPGGYIDPILTIMAIGFVFSGNARGWFSTLGARA
jgi:hypothetical protein